MKIKDVPINELVGKKVKTLNGKFEIFDVEDTLFRPITLILGNGNWTYRHNNLDCEIIEEEPKKMNEENNKPYFDGVKVGDKVWSIEYGWGVVEIMFQHSFRVRFGRKDEAQVVCDYNFKGVPDSRNPKTKQTLFWDEIKFEIPKKPEKWVKKSEEYITSNLEDQVTEARLHLTSGKKIRNFKSKRVVEYEELES